MLRRGRGTMASIAGRHLYGCCNRTEAIVTVKDVYNFWFLLVVVGPSSQHVFYCHVIKSSLAHGVVLGSAQRVWGSVSTLQKFEAYGSAGSIVTWLHMYYIAYIFLCCARALSFDVGSLLNLPFVAFPLGVKAQVFWNELIHDDICHFRKYLLLSKRRQKISERFPDGPILCNCSKTTQHEHEGLFDQKADNCGEQPPGHPVVPQKRLESSEEIYAHLRRH